MKILHLTLKKKWFDMIASGEKKEEYRTIKPYFRKRLCDEHPGCIGGDFMSRHKNIAYTFKEFDIVRLRNGYSKTSPVIDIEFKAIRIAMEGNTEWGWTEPCYAIQLGNIINHNHATNPQQI